MRSIIVIMTNDNHDNYHQWLGPTRIRQIASPTPISNNATEVATSL